MKTALAFLGLVGILAYGVTNLTGETASEPLPAGDMDKARQQLAELVVDVEDTGHHYDREDWPHWDYLGDGCDVRDKVLQEQGTDVTVSSDGKCTVTGSWLSVYDGQTETDSSDIDIDHMVPLAEANRSGTRHWTEAERETYANDTRFLVAVTDHSNQQKSDQDPPRWMPSVDGFHCEYVAWWIDAKHTYALEIDVAEKDVLMAELEQC